MRRDSRSRSGAAFVIITLSIYAAITLFMLARHAPWRDEADPWLTARDLPLTHLWAFMHYVGTPALWILILLVPAKLGLPYIWLKIVHWLFGFANAAMILTLAPFPRLLRAALIFSFYLAYEYIVISRNYAPLATLLILIAWSYPKRYERPFTLAILLALLASIAAHGTIFAAALGGAWGLDAMISGRASKRVLWAGCLAAAGVLLGVAEILPTPPDGQLAGVLVVRNADAADYIFSHTFTPLYPQTPGPIMTHLRHGSYPLFLLAWAFPRWLTAIFFIATLWLSRRNPPLFLAFLFSLIALLYVFIFKHLGGDRHTGLIWLFAWIMLWILRTDPATEQSTRRDAHVWSGLWIPIALSSFYCIVITLYQLSVRTPYSGSRAAAEFLLDHHLADRPLAMYEDNRCEPILPYLGKKIVWYAGEDRYGTYMLWNAKLEREEYEAKAAIARMMQKSAADPDMVLVLNTHLPPELAGQFELVFDNTTTRHIIPDESYAIYVRSGG